MEDDNILINFSEQFASKYDIKVIANDGVPVIIFKFDEDIIEILVTSFNTIKNQIMIKCLMNDESIGEKMINLENLLSIKYLQSKFKDGHPQILISQSISHHWKIDSNKNRVEQKDLKIWMDAIEWFFRELKDICLSEESILYKNIMISSLDLIPTSNNLTIDITEKLSSIKMYEIATEYNKFCSKHKFVRLPGPKSKNRFTATSDHNMALLPCMKARDSRYYRF